MRRTYLRETRFAERAWHELIPNETKWGAMVPGEIEMAKKSSAEAQVKAVHPGAVCVADKATYGFYVYAQAKCAEPSHCLGAASQSDGESAAWKYAAAHLKETLAKPRAMFMNTLRIEADEDRVYLGLMDCGPDRNRPEIDGPTLSITLPLSQFEPIMDQFTEAFETRAYKRASVRGHG
jgi:hypothetical protein